MNEIEDLVTRTLRDPARALPAAADPLPGIRARARAQRRHAVLAAAVMVLLVAATLAVPAAVSRLTQPAPTASVPGDGLLPWLARGDLTGDTGLIRAAERVWRSGSGLRPTGEVSTLYAGWVGPDRVVLLQALTPGGPAVVQVTDQDSTLRLVAADLLPRPAPAVLRLVDPGPAPYQVRLLAGPDTYSIEVFDSNDTSAFPGGLRGERGGDGLVLVDKVIDTPRPLAVALDMRDQALGSGLLPEAGQLPATQGPVTVVPSGWDPGRGGEFVGVAVPDGALLAGRLGGPVEIAQLGDHGTGVQLSGEHNAMPRFYEVHRGDERYLASLVSVDNRTYCLQLQRYTGAGPDAVVLRCALPRFSRGLLAVLARTGIRSGRLTLGGATRTLKLDGGGYVETTGPNFPTGAGQLAPTDQQGHARPVIDVPAYHS